jgi:hypothetical protein
MVVDIQTMEDGKIARMFRMENGLGACSAPTGQSWWPKENPAETAALRYRAAGEQAGRSPVLALDGKLGHIDST